MALLEAFAPVSRTDVKANWMSILDILVHKSRYCVPSGTQSKGSQPTGRGPFTPYTTTSPSAGAKHSAGHSHATGATSSNGTSQSAGTKFPPGNTPSAGTHASTDHPPSAGAKHSTESSQSVGSSEGAHGEAAYQGALNTGTHIITGIIGKAPPDLGVIPQCDQSRSGMVYGIGNIARFFNMSATEKTSAAQRQVREQYVAILKQIHPDKHAGEGYDALRAYVDLTKAYTTAYDQAGKWFRSTDA